MPLAVTVEASETFPSNQAVTLSKLRKAAKPNVAITGSVGGTDLEANSVSNTNIASDAGIDISKLAGQAEDNIILVSDTSDGSGKKLITSAAPDGNAAIELSSGKAKITPSDETITGSKLDDKSENDNVISHLTATTSVAADDYVMVHDTSVTGDTNANLKKIKVNLLNAVGTTSYSLSQINPTLASGNDFNVEIDLDGDAFQTLEIANSKHYRVYCKAGSFPTGGSTVKTVTVRIKNITNNASANGNFGLSSADAANKWPTGWLWPERPFNRGPATLAGSKSGLLSITAFGSADADVVACWIESI